MFANTGAAFLRYIPHRAGCAHIVFVLAVAVASTAQAADAGSTGKKKTAAAVHGTKPAPTAKNEYIHVNASRSMPDGVTLNAPGGGRMSVETEARSQTTLTRDYIAKQSPTAQYQYADCHGAWRGPWGEGPDGDRKRPYEHARP